MSLSHQEDPWAGRDRRDDAEKFGAKLGVRLLCAPPPLHTHPFRTIAPILAPEPSVLVRKAQCGAGGDRRAVGCAPVHDLAGHRGPDRCDRPGPEGRAAHCGGGARGLRLRGGRHPLPLLELAESPRIVVGQARDDRHERPDPGPAQRQAGVGLPTPTRDPCTTRPHWTPPDCSTESTPPDGSPTRDTSAGE